jgi:hypothetical protein
MDIDHEVMKKVFGGGFWESSIKALTIIVNIFTIHVLSAHMYLHGLFISHLNLNSLFQFVAYFSPLASFIGHKTEPFVPDFWINIY